jgi:hypothetical protein
LREITNLEIPSLLSPTEMKPAVDRGHPPVQFERSTR